MFPTEALCDQAALGFRLLQIEAHVHLAVHARGSGQVLARLFAIANLPVELAEPQVAMSDKRPHAARLSEHQRFAVVHLGSFSVEPILIGCDIAEQTLRMGDVTWMRWRMLEC